MNNTPDTTATPAPGNGGAFDPRDAAALLGHTTLQARRRLEPFPPAMSLIRALIALAAYGTIWLSVRGQHPYKGPGIGAILVVVALAAVNIGATVILAKRALTGVRGRARPQRSEIVLMSLVWIAVFAIMAVLPTTGVSDAVAFGQYPASVPLIVAGATWAVMTALRADYLAFATASAVVAVGVASAFAGPVGAWAVAGIGLCVILVGRATAAAWRQRAGTTRP